MKIGNLLLLFITPTPFLLRSSRSALAFHTTSTTTTVGRCQGEVDVLLRVKADNERGYVDNLLSDTKSIVSQ